MRVFLFGSPGEIGGAMTERMHTCLLWRRAGIDVTILRVSHCVCGERAELPLHPDRPRFRPLLEAGCAVVTAAPGKLHEVPGLAGGIVVAFCSAHVCHLWDELRAINCQVVVSPCMTYVASHERKAFLAHPPAALHVQSFFQQQIAGWYTDHGCLGERHYLIRGALDLAEFPCQPRPRDGRAFCVGRLARPQRSKWPRFLWPMLQGVRERRIDLRASCMAWSDDVERFCGPPPPWAETYPAGAISARNFLAGCHALICPNSTDQENWPRVGLEAMASGVPVVADNRGGWREMLVHGETGILCDTPADYTDALTRLANDELFRMRLIANARAAVEQWTDPERLGQQWLELFANLDAERKARTA